MCVYINIYIYKYIHINIYINIFIYKLMNIVYFYDWINRVIGVICFLEFQSRINHLSCKRVKKVSFDQASFIPSESKMPGVFTKTKHTLTYIHNNLSINVTIPDSGCTHDMSSDVTMFESTTLFICKGNNTLFQHTKRQLFLYRGGVDHFFCLMMWLHHVNCLVLQMKNY